MTDRPQRRLRRDATDAEKRLWRYLRNRGLEDAKFRRQEPVGPYAADFLCYERMLIVEIDGGQHASHQEADAERTRWLEARDFRVIRFWNHDVMENTEGVLAEIARHLKGRGS